MDTLTERSKTLVLVFDNPKARVSYAMDEDKEALGFTSDDDYITYRIQMLQSQIPNIECKSCIVTDNRRQPK